MKEIVNGEVTRRKAQNMDEQQVPLLINQHDDGHKEQSTRSMTVGFAKDVMDNAVHPPGRFLTYQALPDWRKDNHFILGSYRLTSNSYPKSYASLAYLHNESVNIYTHGLGAIVAPIAGVVLCYKLKNVLSTGTIGDVLACGCFFLGASLCLGMSSTYHTIMNHSPRVNQFGNALDYLGIVCLIAGSYVPNIYYGYYCEPKLQIAYWTLVRTLNPTSNTNIHR